MAFALMANTPRNTTMADLRLKDISSRKSKILISQGEKRDEDRPARGASSKGEAKGKGKENAKQIREETACARPRKANAYLEIGAHSGVNQTREATWNGRPRSPSPTGLRPKGVMTGMQSHTKNFW